MMLRVRNLPATFCQPVSCLRFPPPPLRPSAVPAVVHLSPFVRPETIEALSTGLVASPPSRPPASLAPAPVTAAPPPPAPATAAGASPHEVRGPEAFHQPA